MGTFSLDKNNSVTVNGQTTTFTYDGNGALVRKDDGVGVTLYPSAASGQAVGGLYEKYEMPAER